MNRRDPSSSPLSPRNTSGLWHCDECGAANDPEFCDACDECGYSDDRARVGPLSRNIGD